MLKKVQCNLSSVCSCPDTCYHKKLHEPHEEEYIFDGRVQRCSCKRVSGCKIKDALVKCIEVE